MARKINAQTLHDWLLDGDEIAVFDVREEGVFGQEHLLRCNSVPLSRLELLYRKFAPRKTVRMVLIDADDGLADRAAKILTAAGYADISVLDGGVQAWDTGGFELFSGINVPSKVFGEHVEHHCGTPNISADDLKAKLDAGENLVVLDSRPMDEYHRMNIPTGVDSPGAELVYRVRDLAPDPKTTVVVNCAGRTRSIIGAQSLINAGVPNKVMALTNGTMGWHLAGYELENGSTRIYDGLSDGALEWSQSASAAVAEKFGVKTIDVEAFKTFQGESDQRSLFLFDVRAPEEYAAGHAVGAVSAPGGQLVQATDRYVGTYNSRLVLIDDTGVRARMTASWLVQMGWPEVYVLENGLRDLPQEAAAPELSVPELRSVEQITPDDLSQRRSEFTVLDVSDSLQFRDGHIPGANWLIRARLAVDLAKVSSDKPYVVTGRDPNLIQLAAADLSDIVDQDVCALSGGNDAWRDAGLDMTAGWENTVSEKEDVFYRPYDREGSPEEAMNQYLTWEIALVEQIKRDGTLQFPHFDPN